MAAASNGSPMWVLMRICGESVPLGPMRRHVAGDLKSFQESLQAAISYRQ
jgi:hypothetical protein